MSCPEYFLHFRLEKKNVHQSLSFIIKQQWGGALDAEEAKPISTKHKASLKKMHPYDCHKCAEESITTWSFNVKLLAHHDHLPRTEPPNPPAK